MKSQNRVSQLTLELYYRGLATNKERRLVEKALETDSETRKKYEALQESYREIRRLITQELNRQNIPERPAAPPPRKKRVAVFILAAAVLLCALIPAIFYLKSYISNKDNAIAEETNFTEDIPGKEIAAAEEPPVIAEPSEPPAVRERGNPGNRIEIAEKPHTETARPTEPELQIEPKNGVSIATVPEPDTGIRLRGEGQAKDQEEPPNINIPPGISFIFDNMFANRNLTFVIIPARITSIGKNAFQGNPLLSVTIGANVSIEDSAIPGNFAAAYNANGKAAGTYTRADANSGAWEKK